MNRRYLSYFLLGLCTVAGAHAATSLTVALDPAERYLNPLEFVDVNGNVTGYAGVIQVTLDGTDLLDVFCVDLYHDVSPGITYTYTAYAVNDPSLSSFSTNLEQAAWLYVNELPVVNAAPASEQGIYGAALQLAIWDVVDDNAGGLSAGSIQAQTSPAPDPNSAAAYALASTWIADSTGQSSTDATILMNVNGPTASQTFITSSAAMVDVFATPEPGTMALVGAALLIVGLARKRAWRNDLRRFQGLRISMPPLK